MSNAIAATFTFYKIIFIIIIIIITIKDLKIFNLHVSIITDGNEQTRSSIPSDLLGATQAV